MKDLQKHIEDTKNLFAKQTDPEKKVILEDYEALLVKAKGLSNPTTIFMHGVT